GFRLDKRQNALRGGDYGSVITPGKSAESKLILRLVGPEAGLQMPPTGPLSDEEIGVLRAWIDPGGEISDVAVGDVVHGVEKPLDPKVKTFLDAVRRADSAAVKKMLKADRALANARDNEGATALMHAAGFGGAAMMRLLIEAGAEVNAKNHRNASALLWAANDAEAVRLLLEQGAEPNVKSVEGRTPLVVAAQEPGGADILKMLLDNGAD